MRGHLRNSFDAPTRTRTRDSSLGPRRDRPLHHQGFVHNRSIIKTEYDILDLRNMVHEPTTFSPAVTLASYLKDAGAGRDVRATLPNSRMPGGGQVIVRERPRDYRVEYSAATQPLPATSECRERSCPGRVEGIKSAITAIELFDRVIARLRGEL